LPDRRDPARRGVALDVVVTGATSNVGADVALCLAGRGHKVRAIALPGLPREHLDRAGIPLAFVDVTDEEPLTRALDGAEAVVHCAGLVAFGPRVRERLFRVNVGGARSCVRAARKAGARRFVHISSVGVYGLPSGRRRIDEQTPTAASGIAYNDSKREGEQAVRDEAGPLALTVLRPSGVYGRYDRLVIPHTVTALRARRYMYLGDRTRPFTLIGASYLAEAIARLLERPPPESPALYVAAEGPPPPTHRVVEAIADELGEPHPKRSVPAPALRVLAWLADRVDRFRGAPGQLSTELLANALVDAEFDGSALRRRVGLEAIDSAEGVRKVVRAMLDERRV
jgi:nucleoside-diphosphate-sugar epimerase